MMTKFQVPEVGYRYKRIFCLASVRALHSLCALYSLFALHSDTSIPVYIGFSSLS